MKDFQPIDGSAAYTAANSAVAAVASATDIFEIAGSASKVIKVRQVIISGIATAAAYSIVKLLKRSTANTGGTATTLTNVPLDSTSAAATAVCKSYTANPTTGNLVGMITAIRVPLLTATTATAAPIVINFDSGSSMYPITLRGTAQSLVVNLDGVTITGGAISCSFLWTEE